jgi:hypothetical protein
VCDAVVVSAIPAPLTDTRLVSCCVLFSKRPAVTVLIFWKLLKTWVESVEFLVVTLKPQLGCAIHLQPGRTERC